MEKDKGEYYLLGYNALGSIDSQTDVLEEHIAPIFRVKE
jgi:hypothetical protein